jgi:MFS family permease
LSDRLGRKFVYGLGAVGGALWSIAFFYFCHTALALIFGVVVGLAFHAIMYGPQAAFIAEQFPARLRYTGSSLAYTFAGLVGGAIAPMIFSLMMARPGHEWLMGAYIAIACLVTLMGLWLARSPRP